MGTFTRIPETAMAGVLGLALGAASGTVFSAANSTIKNLQSKIDDLNSKLVEGDTSVCKSIPSLEATLGGLEKSVQGLEQSLSSVENVSVAVMVPLIALRVAVAVIKSLPVPQQYMVVSFTVLQSDTLELLMEKIAQINEIAAGIAGVTGGFNLVLSPLKSSISSLRQALATASVSCALGETVNESNQELSSFIAQLNEIINSNVKRAGYLVDLKSGLEDIHTALVETLIDTTQTGQYVAIPKDTGDWIAAVYRKATSTPDKPKSTIVPPEGWTLIEPQGSCWKSTANVSGKSGKVLGPWTNPVKYEGSASNYLIPIQYDLVRKWDYEMIKDIPNKPGITGSILYLKDTDEAYNLLHDIVNQTGISPELKDKFEEAFALTVENASAEDLIKQVEINGQIYTLKIVSDPNSPKIAVARFVEAYNSLDKLVATGDNSFAKDNEVLFNDMIIKLRQLFL